jgi:hypothetical protein
VKTSTVQTSIEIPYREELIDPRDLLVDTSYQRSEVISAKKIKDWCPFSATAIVVARRADGSFWIVDGQQRVIAARRLGVPAVYAIVFTSPGRDFEARVFVRINVCRSGVNALQAFRAMLEAKQPGAVEVDLLVRSHGLSIPLDQRPAKAWPNVRAVAAIMKVASQDIALLDRTLATVVRCWRGNVLGIGCDMIAGVSMFIQKHSPTKQTLARLTRFAPEQISEGSRAMKMKGVKHSGHHRAYRVCKQIEVCLGL